MGLIVGGLGVRREGMWRFVVDVGKAERWCDFDGGEG